MTLTPIPPYNASSFNPHDFKSSRRAYTQHLGWNIPTKWYTQYPEPLQVAILVISLCFVAASAFIAQRFDTEVLRALEGYWYPGIRRLLQPFVKR